MKYVKPMILSVNDAASAIQGQGKDNPNILDSSHMPATVTGYEADE